MEKYKSTLIILGILVGTILFLEITFRINALDREAGFSFASLFTMDFLRKILFTLSYAMFIVAFIKIFKQKTVKWLIVVFHAMLVALYFSQDIYKAISNNFYSVAFSGDLAAGFTFFYRLPQTLRLGHFVYLLPFILAVVLVWLDHKGKIAITDVRYTSYKQPVFYSVLAVLMLFITVQTISDDHDEDDYFSFSDYDLYVELSMPETAMRKYGVVTYARIDLQNALMPNRIETLTDQHAETLFDINPEYEYVEGISGIFEGKNLIMIMAEALDTYAIHPELTPNLYALVEESWYFDNFYAPLYYRNTADTEFMVQTSFYPNRTNQLSMSAYIDNYFPYTFPRLFDEYNYTSLAFHNFSDHFYPRAEFHPGRTANSGLGFHEYFGPDRLGMVTPSDEEREASGHYWHSDLEMFERSLPYLFNEDQFYAYFLTVVGHLPYEGGRHDIALQYYPVIDEILTDIGLEDIPEPIKYYHAAHWDFDLAIGYLLDTLEENNLRDDTVIVIFGDHYAYGLDADMIWEYDTVKDDSIPLNIHNVPFIIANPSLEPKTINNLFSSVDILPTLANMFNLSLDYSKVMGNDAFNSVMNTVIFSNVSFLTEAYYYSVDSGDSLVSRIGETLDYKQERSLVGEVLFRNRVNNYILDEDYFRKLYLDD